MIEAPLLETERLWLRPYRTEDFDDFEQMWREPEVTRFMGGVPISREASWARFLRHRGIWQTFGFGFFAIEDKATGAFVGECGFHDLRRAIVPSLEGTMETGWALTPSFQRRGLAEEAARAALGWAGRQHPQLRQTCLIDAGHRASLRVADKLGFTEFARATYSDKPVVLLQRPHTV